LTQVAARSNNPQNGSSLRARQIGGLALPVLLAVVYTLLNAVKPLQIDDAAYEYYARQMATRPLDPYGFAVFWWDHPYEANEVLAPPVFCYSWAVVRRLTDDPFLWKLCLLPWSLLLVLGLQGLLRRFARRLERPLLVLLVFSPALLPSLNLMLDVPALALTVASLNLYFRAADRDSLVLAAWAGLAAGVAMQTKYTALLAPGAMLLWSMTTGRWRLWPVAALVAAHVFVAWEFVVAALYGRSHFLIALSLGGSLQSKVEQLPFLTSQLGGLVPAGVLLGLAALGVGRRALWFAAGVVLAGFAVVTLFDVRFVTTVDMLGRPVKEPLSVQFAEVLFNAFCLVGAAVVFLAGRRLLRAESAVGDRTTLFLILWLGLEVLGYVAMTPFPAARRVLGVGLVSSLLVGRLAARRARLLWRRGVVPWLTAGGVALALVYWALDWHGAWVQKDAVDTAAVYVARHGGGRVWYVGHWGFQFHAERRHMEPVVPRYPDWMTTDGPVPLPPATVFAPGDWLVLPEARLIQQKVALPEDRLELMTELALGGGVPLRTVPCFYGGRTPVEHHTGASLAVRVYRVRAGFLAEPSKSPPFETSR
jgi:hypothetical protein